MASGQDERDGTVPDGSVRDEPVRNAHERNVAERIRAELALVREAEGRVEEALGEVRRARLRLEALARESTSGSGRSGAAGGRAPERERSVVAPTAAVESPRRLLVLGAIAFVAVVLVGWLAIQGIQRGSAGGGPTATVGPASEPALDAAEETSPSPGGPLARLPDGPAAREAFYDSLWAVRSPLFDPLLATVEEETDEATVERVAEAWREGELDLQQADLLHSAFVQAAIAERTGRPLELDGQLLRNPCRGRSCLALLELWREEGDRYGLPDPPDDAATNTAALRRAEVALVLDHVRELNARESVPADP